MKALPSIVLSALLLAGCSSGGISLGGNEDKLSHEYLTKHLIVGKTTKSDVRRDFGEPEPRFISFDSSGTEIWYYPVDEGFDLIGAAASLVPISGASSAAKVANNQSGKGAQPLVISFDKNGVVESWLR
ncbi:hypothetical protein [Pectobacterium sp. B2J-2]|uniref:hypothetical protein n=1 Tax=Pectobacterium sp. B2J-2 TaxID=3385372 RepID=UPI0038FC60FC